MSTCEPMTESNCTEAWSPLDPIPWPDTLPTLDPVSHRHPHPGALAETVLLLTGPQPPALSQMTATALVALHTATQLATETGATEGQVLAMVANALLTR